MSTNTEIDKQVKDLEHHYDKVVDWKDYFYKPDIYVLKGTTQNGLKLFRIWEDFYAMELGEFKKYLTIDCEIDNQEVEEIARKIENKENVNLMCCMSTKLIGDIWYVVGPHFDFIETKENK